MNPAQFSPLSESQTILFNQMHKIIQLGDALPHQIKPLLVNMLPPLKEIDPMPEYKKIRANLAAYFGIHDTDATPTIPLNRKDIVTKEASEGRSPTTVMEFHLKVLKMLNYLLASKTFENIRSEAVNDIESILIKAADELSPLAVLINDISDKLRYSPIGNDLASQNAAAYCLLRWLLEKFWQKDLLTLHNAINEIVKTITPRFSTNPFLTYCNEANLILKAHYDNIISAKNEQSAHYQTIVRDNLRKFKNRYHRSANLFASNIFKQGLESRLPELSHLTETSAKATESIKTITQQLEACEKELLSLKTQRAIFQDELSKLVIELGRLNAKDSSAELSRAEDYPVKIKSIEQYKTYTMDPGGASERIENHYFYICFPNLSLEDCHINGICNSLKELNHIHIDKLKHLAQVKSPYLCRLDNVEIEINKTQLRLEQITQLYNSEKKIFDDSEKKANEIIKRLSDDPKDSVAIDLFISLCNDSFDYKALLVNSVFLHELLPDDFTLQAHRMKSFCERIEKRLPHGVRISINPETLEVLTLPQKTSLTHTEVPANAGSGAPTMDRTDSSLDPASESIEDIDKSDALLPTTNIRLPEAPNADARLVEARLLNQKLKNENNELLLANEAKAARANSLDKQIDTMRAQLLSLPFYENAIAELTAHSRAISTTLEKPLAAGTLEPK